MDIQQIGLLSNGDLDAVVGGMMNNHQGDPLQTPKNTGGHGGGGGVGGVVGALIDAVVVVGIAATIIGL